MSADALSDELSAMLGESDPELRDDIAYTLLAHWLAVKPVISDAQARRLVDGWILNVQPGTRGSDDRSVVHRSFAALTLAAAVARENDRAFMGEERYRAVFNAAKTYFDAETDARGFDTTLGWVHATAHTADLLKFLLRNKYLTPADQRAALRAIVLKVTATRTPWVAGEDERIGRAVMSLVSRADLQWDAFGAFVADVGRAARFPEQPTPESLARQINARHLLTACCALLSVSPESPAIDRARKQIVDVLAGN